MGLKTSPGGVFFATCLDPHRHAVAVIAEGRCAKAGVIGNRGVSWKAVSLVEEEMGDGMGDGGR